MHSEIVEGDRGGCGDLGREPGFGRGDARRAHQVSICLPEG
jgi:hypothetical protein